MGGRPSRKVIVGRVKTEAVNLRVSPDTKQMFYDVADRKRMTLTAVFEEMLMQYNERCQQGK